MKSIYVIVILIVLFLVICFIGYKLGTDDQKYERDTGRDFASNRDKDRGGYYGGGYGGGYGSYGRPRTRSYDSDDDDPYDLSSPIDDMAEDSADEGGYEDYNTADDEPRAPEF